MIHTQTIQKGADLHTGIRRGIVACVVVFVAVLILSALWDASIRVLHVFEVLLYLVIATLAFRPSKFAYALTFAGGVMWLWCGSGLTTFVRNGFQMLLLSVRTGHVQRPDLLIAIPAALATGGLVLLALTGYGKIRGKSAADFLLFAACFGGVWAFYLCIFAAFTPRYLQMFQPVWRLFG